MRTGAAQGVVCGHHERRRESVIWKDYVAKVVRSEYCDEKASEDHCNKKNDYIYICFFLVKVILILLFLLVLQTIQSAEEIPVFLSNPLLYAMIQTRTGHPQKKAGEHSMSPNADLSNARITSPMKL